MRVNLLITMIIFTLIWPVTALRAAVSKTTWADAPAHEFVFVKNNSDNNFFITPGRALDPRLTSANHWTSLKYTGSGTIYQQSLSYIDNSYNTSLYTNWKFDMWLENSPVSSPLTGLRCINWYTGCNMTTSLILPQTTNTSGFYGTTVTSSSAKWMHSMLSDTFYQYLQQMPISSSFTMTINACQTSVNYDTSSSAHCKDQASSNWYVHNITHTKAANLQLINTHSLAEVFINSNRVPTLGKGNTNCQTQTISSHSGLSCKMVNYTLQTNRLSNTSIHIFPAITNSSLASAIRAYNMQFSLNGSSWKPVSNTAYYYTFNKMKSTDSIYVFFSSNFFKQMVNQGISNINTKDLFNFHFQNTTSPESGWYEFSTSNTLIIKPHDFSISIISNEYTQTPSQEGYVGSSKSALNFSYIITTSSKTAANKVLIKVTRPTQVIGRHSYCVFSSNDSKAKVPFPATLSFITHNRATKTYNARCNDSWQDMTNALWLTTPWTDISGKVGQMDKTTVKFSIPMDNTISLHTVDDNSWFGKVSTSGEIHVQATWHNIN